MELMRLLRETDAKGRRELVRSSLIGALADCSTVVLLVHAADQALLGIFHESALALFMVLLTLILISRRKTFLDTSVLLANFNHQFRTQLLGQVLRVDLANFERIGRERVFSALASDTHVVAEAAEILANLLYMGSVLLIFFAYLVWLSPPVALLAVSIFGLLSWLYLLNIKRSAGLEARSQRDDERYFDALSGVIAGFKELKINRQKCDDFYRHGFEHARAEQLETGIQAGRAYATNFLMSDSAILLVGTLTVFLLPKFIGLESSVVVHAVVVICLIPIATVMRDFPVLRRADKAAQRLAHMRTQLAGLAADAPLEGRQDPHPRVLRQGLELQGVEYLYQGDNPDEYFEFGPVDLTLPAGQITFVIGGNGSGKSTLIKLLTGLYRADVGAFLVDGEALDIAQRRELFSIILSDFHLFDRVYGQGEVSSETLNAHLATLRIDDKVHYTEQGYSTLALSSGQKKRVALAACLLEARPVYVFDEWAADQDPEFRDYFYRELLPMLKAKGKTIVVVTHDERYFDLCDQRVKLEYGRVVQVERLTQRG